MLHEIALTMIPSVGPTLAKNLIAYCGSAEAVFNTPKAKLVKIPLIGNERARSILENKEVLKKAEVELAFIAKHKIEPLFFGAHLASQICSIPDELLAYCDIEDKTDPVDTYYAPRGWCVQKPWKKSNIGTYEDDFVPKGIPSHTDFECGDYYYGDQNAKGATNWQPIYCRSWLLLDNFDLKEGEVLDPMSFFGKPTITDNCSGTLEPEVKNEGSINECGVGSILRTWTVTDACGLTSSCHQRVTILPRSDFEVRFPADITLDCSKETADDTSPRASPGEPVISDDDCEHIGIHYEDQVFPVFEESCFKILRTWRIIDWCTYEPSLTYRESDVIVDDNLRASDTRPCVFRNIKDNGDGYIEYLQVIRVRDLKAPTVKCAKIADICYDSEEWRYTGKCAAGRPPGIAGDLCDHWWQPGTVQTIV